MDIKNLLPQNGRFKQGFYHPRNADKYIGDLNKIIFRSSWEYKFCKYCDMSINVVKWSSEPIPIPYISPLDSRPHTYNVDFYMRVVLADGSERQFLIEVKPNSQTKAPKKPTGRITEKKLRIYTNDLKTFLVNQAKFNTAKSYAKSRGYQFLVLTEDFFDGKNQVLM